MKIQMTPYQKLVTGWNHFRSYWLAVLYIRVHQHQARRCGPGDHPQK
jgi:hypothetical protein